MVDFLASDVLQTGEEELDLAKIFSFWKKRDPVAAAAENAGEDFLKLIFLLENTGVVQIIADVAEDADFPKKVFVPANAEKDTFEKSVWHPSLIFAASELTAEDRLFLHCINDWMNSRHTDATQKVPLEERSFDIFGDERVLGDLYHSNNDIFSYLSLSDLRCYDLRPQLVWTQDHLASTLDVLVVETSSAYDSFCRYNAEHHIWRGVVFGQGNNFNWLHEGLQDVLGVTKSQRALYLGDISPESVLLLSKIMEQYPDQVLVPYFEFYDRMLRVGQKRVGCPGGRLPTDLVKRTEKMFPVMAPQFLSLWQQKMIVPLACLGYERLIRDQIAAPKGTLHWHRDDDYSNYRS